MRNGKLTDPATRSRAAASASTGATGPKRWSASLAIHSLGEGTSGHFGAFTRGPINVDSFNGG
jgi:hypothetical protein